MNAITYISEQPKDYSDALTACKTLDELQQTLNSYRTIASDAVEAIPKNQKEFAQFRAGLRKERKGQFAGEDWAETFMSIVMPEVMFKVSMMASRFMVPWGCAYIRMKEVGAIKIDSDGIARIIEKKRQSQ